jgi:murein DD-endopeptidase MepM/ murein hydrolase activator NlpD
MALDIATWLGKPVVAADGGRVIAVGWDNSGYGYRVIIDHGGGVRTLYAHLSRYTVDYGEYVNKGQMIGRVGSTGQSTGPHLHFEVRRYNYRVNPWDWLP